MSWSQKYRRLKVKNKANEESQDIPPEAIFNAFSDKLTELYDSLKDKVDGTMIQSKLHKLAISKNPRDAMFSEKEKVDALVLSDNDNELKIIPDGIHFIGVLGRVSIRAYKKVYSFNSIIEKRIKTLKEPYFFLIQDEDSPNSLIWGYVRDEDNSFFGNEVVRLTDAEIEKVLDEVFLDV
ncbi:MAG: hypothetical protein OEZ36_07110 [Spirochaetota bacterium]|nr:hypothetical protein [Spirochaetota bacterium]